ncbi:MAG: TetR/AcrR family transcriptional regulator [Myxococcales bacterium]|nr:TetR/AcrR family transcriptional regulator [Myxococcales bacterium]
MARPRQVTDDEILEAARACFIEHGPSCPTTVIAERLGVSQAALFKRFGTKQELMCSALMPPPLPGWIELVEKGPDERPIPVQLTEIAQAVASFFEEFAPRLTTLKASGVDIKALMSRYDVPPPLRGILGLSKWMATAAEQGRIRTTQPRTAALLFLGSFQGRAFLSHVFGFNLTDQDEYVAEIVATVWRGLAPEEDP